MFPPVVTKDPAAVQVEVQAAYNDLFPNADPAIVPQAFDWALKCFNGKYKDYHAIDAAYHDFEHTMQGLLCMTRLLRGRHNAGAHPQITLRVFQLGILAMLMHDTGYLKRNEDIEGTGAKYTVTHVTRSAEFAATLLSEKGFNAGDIQSVQNMIQCTGVDSYLAKIPFQNEVEKIAGHALGTADLLGQMAADDYVEKLPILYSEFAEAAAGPEASGTLVTTFSSAEDLMRKTPSFWENYVQNKLNREFSGVYRFLNDPYPYGPNEYLQRIEANIAKIRQRLSIAAE